MNKNISEPLWQISDTEFDKLYPERIRQLSGKHWTPMEIVKKSARFLAAEPGTKILDIGSGAGKFCLIGACHFPESYFYGIEQRKDLHQVALSAKGITGIKNVSFLFGNLTQLDHSRFDHFYFYNAFFENLVSDGHIDQLLPYSTELYHYYSRYLYRILEGKRNGTRLVTFHSLEDEVPPCYQLVDATLDLNLKMWIKR
ncbi:methyltransferase domain-containing protein [Chitinophaga niabensis]|uniref:Methyltransferase domain-containing protein n=1 Tax=Chitinophaga niabensis TaxID=536979 RepID=A0A1N6D359_9BACT|nr:methyltransferase domain-containing protein [Chitinophaga niabensis]SIN65231.1 Methyltransferase domain-containing protein [Chitinophaga niabensis]